MPVVFSACPFAEVVCRYVKKEKLQKAMELNALARPLFLCIHCSCDEIVLGSQKRQPCKY